MKSRFDRFFPHKEYGILPLSSVFFQNVRIFMRIRMHLRLHGYMYQMISAYLSAEARKGFIACSSCARTAPRSIPESL